MNVRIKCNGREFRGFNSVNMTRSLDQIAATYAASVFRDASDSSAQIVPIFPDDSVEILVDDELVISGYNESVATSMNGGSFACTVSGKESTVDLVKCPCTELVYSNKRADEIVRRICADLGILFALPSNVDVGAPFKSFAVQPSTKAFDAIRQVCKERRLFPISSGTGRVTLNGSSYGVAETSLEQGVNVVSFASNFSNAERYSKYRVISANDPSGRTQAEAIDDQVDRSREWVLMDTQYASRESCEARAKWEAHHRQARANALNVTVNGWRQSPNGSLWTPGVLVNVNIPAIGCDCQKLVNKVNYTYGNNGVNATLELVSPELYEQAPAFAKRKKMTADTWASVRKQTGSKLR